MRHGSTLVESTGQLRFSFDDSTDSLDSAAQTISIHRSPGSGSSASQTPGKLVGDGSGPQTLDQMVEQAMLAEDEEELDSAVDGTARHWRPLVPMQMYVSNWRNCCIDKAMRLLPANAITWHLNWMKRLVEVRVNLGCVLAELGQFELAVAAFEGTLQQFGRLRRCTLSSLRPRS